MTLKQLKILVTDLLEEGELKKALVLLEHELAENASQERNSCVQLKARLKNYQKEEDAGIITFSTTHTGFSQIVKAIQNLLGDLKPEHLHNQNAEQQSRIQALLEEMGFPALPLAGVVDCDRTKPINVYRSAFGQNRDLSSQFYFITGCPTQKPDSLAERIIYELRDKHYQGVADTIFYETEQRELGKGSAWYVTRMKAVPLPFLHYNRLTENQAAFIQYLSQTLPGAVPADVPLEVLLEQKENRPAFRMITLVFTIDIDEYDGWPATLTAYLDWLITVFKRNSATAPVFKFLFVIQSNGIHTKDHPEVKEGIDTLKTNHNIPDQQFCTRIEQLLPAESPDLKRWFSQRTNNLYPLQIEEMVENYTKKYSFDMNNIETFLLDIYKYTNQTR